MSEWLHQFAQLGYSKDGHVMPKCLDSFQDDYVGGDWQPAVSPKTRRGRVATTGLKIRTEGVR